LLTFCGKTKSKSGFGAEASINKNNFYINSTLTLVTSEDFMVICFQKKVFFLYIVYKND